MIAIRHNRVSKVALVLLGQPRRHQSVSTLAKTFVLAAMISFPAMTQEILIRAWSDCPH